MQTASGRITRYDGFTRFLHWLMGLLILLQFAKFFDRIDDGEHWLGETVVPTHVSIGLLLLALILLRIFWTWRTRGMRPAYVGRTAPLAKLGHFLLYAAMLLLPILGICYMIGNGYGLSFFGTRLVEKGPEIDLAMSIGALHSPLAWALLLLALGHTAAAFYHHFVERDGSMRRIL